MSLFGLVASNDIGGVRAYLASGEAIPCGMYSNHTPLHTAARGGYVECIELLIEAGVHPNGASSDGYSPIFFAVQNGHVESFRALVRLGADQHVVTNHKNT